ncbi:hypothetical protein SAMN05216232_0593 [Virgibacillus subterraneus]|uniref:DUF4944 domain-containing protein n=1 Tax=Virgibacillus subterraneus TaxID=621109 RepID=A0A1H8ZXV9_9BACI|nr:hypothetical protein [Virgibacillus subterraneus]SEP69077.1 hypothetical protein SAMN05216232_0593 [Virgibacillus subterraneus]
MNRNKLIIGIVGLVILLIATTSVMRSENREVIEHDYTFAGESENWKAEYHVEGEQVFYEENDTLRGDSESETDIILAYKGKLSELSSVRKLKYKFETSSGSMGSNRTFDKAPEKKVFRHGGASSGVTSSENQEVKVSVQWGEETEEFTLKNKEQP